MTEIYRGLIDENTLGDSALNAFKKNPTTQHFSGNFRKRCLWRGTRKTVLEQRQSHEREPLASYRRYAPSPRAHDPDDGLVAERRHAMHRAALSRGYDDGLVVHRAHIDARTRSRRRPRPRSPSSIATRSEGHRQPVSCRTTTNEASRPRQTDDGPRSDGAGGISKMSCRGNNEHQRTNMRKF